MTNQSNPATEPTEAEKNAAAAEKHASANSTPASASAGTDAPGEVAATAPAHAPISEELENAFRGVVTVIESLIRQIENHIPRAAQLLQHAKDDINQRWGK